MDSLKWTVVLLIWMQMTTGKALEVLSKHEQRLNLLKDVMTQDMFWRHVLNQHVYYEFDKKFYPHIIDDELMHGARGVLKKTINPQASKVSNETAKTDVDPSVETDKASTDTENEGDKTAVDQGPVRDKVIPIRFLRNLFAYRSHIESLVNAGLKIVQTAFKCSAYKHVLHMLTLVLMQISRKRTQKKAISWSAKARESVGLIIVKLGSIQLSDDLLLLSMTFFRVYDRQTIAKAGNRFEFTFKLNYLSSKMREFIGKNCLKNFITDKQITTELKLPTTDALYNGIEAKEIDDKMFKQMFDDSRTMIDDHIIGLPKNGSEMSMDRWNELLRHKVLTENDVEEYERETIWNMNR